MKIAGITINDRDVPLWAMAASAIALLVALSTRISAVSLHANCACGSASRMGAVIVIGVGALMVSRTARTSVSDLAGRDRICRWCGYRPISRGRRTTLVRGAEFVLG